MNKLISCHFFWVKEPWDDNKTITDIWDEEEILHQELLQAPGIGEPVEIKGILYIVKQRIWRISESPGSVMPSQYCFIRLVMRPIEQGKLTVHTSTYPESEERLIS